MSKFGICLLVFISVLYCSKCDPVPNNQHGMFTAAMATIESSLKHYSNELDHAIPWKELRTTLSSTNMRYDFHSPKATNYLKAVREKVSSGTQKYFQSSSIIYGWATFASTSLTIYLEIIDSNKFNGTDIMLDVLERGIDKMSETIPLLEGVYRDFSDASSNLELLTQEFNVTKMHSDGEFLKEQSDLRLSGYAGRVTTSEIARLVARGLTSVLCGEECANTAIGIGAAAMGTATNTAAIEAKFIRDLENVITEIAAYYDTASKAIRNASENINKTILEIRNGIDRLQELKAKVEPTEYLIMGDVVVVAIKRSVRKLIAACNEYVAFHK